jgi:signal transduction histidine kinase
VGLAVDIGRQVRRVENAILGAVDDAATFANGATTGAIDRSRHSLVLPKLARAREQVAGQVLDERLAQQRQIEFLQTLTDSVAAALFVIPPEGGIGLINQAARRLAGTNVSHITDAPSIGVEAGQKLLKLAPGQRELVRLNNGRLMLAVCVEFMTPSMGAHRLLSLQDLSSDLATVELKAWQDLVRTLSHEMMNSLTPIISLADSIHHLAADISATRADEVMLREMRGAAQVIAERSEGLIAFVESYRRVSNVPFARLRPISIVPILEAVELLMRPSLRARGGQFSINIELPKLFIDGDADLLVQACINLLKNAIEAVPPDVTPEISLECRLSNGFVEICVSDNGSGFEAAADQLFVPFFTTKAGGSGVGLNIARQIAVAHGGALEARRAVSGGATFVIVLPGANDQSPANQREPGAQQAAYSQ